MDAYVSALSRDELPKQQKVLQMMIHLKRPLHGHDLSPSIGVWGAEEWSEARPGE